MRQLLAAWRRAGLPVVFTRHDSREAASPLKLSLPTGAMIPGFEPEPGDVVIRKDVNSGFVGTDLELRLRQLGCHRLVIAGFFTNFCVETTTRMAGNLGFNTYVVSDATATFDLVGPDGVHYPAEQVHNLALASLHGEFAQVVDSEFIVRQFEVATAPR